jgi:hypothetical protein
MDKINNLLQADVTQNVRIDRMGSCHVGHTCTHLITKVKQHWARLVDGWMTAQMTSMTVLLEVVVSCGL